MSNDAATKRHPRRQLPLDHHRPMEKTVWTRYRALDPHPRDIPANALADPLAQRVKEQFDPRAILNPGILGEPTA